MDAASRNPEEVVVLRYLLGELSEEEMGEFEERVFREDEFYDFVQGLESELIRDYAAGDLSPAVRKQFEKRYFSNAQLREKVEMAQALREIALARQRSAAEVPAGPAGSFWELLKKAFLIQPPRFRWAAGLASAAVVIGIAAVLTYALVQRGALIEQRARLESERGSLLEQVGRLTARLRTVVPGQAVASFILTPVTKGAGGGPLLVPAEATALQLNLDLPDAANYLGFRVTVRNVDKGGIVWQGGLPKARPGTPGHWLVGLGLDPRLLGSGDFVVALEGITPRGALERLPSFAFELRRR